MISEKFVILSILLILWADIIYFIETVKGRVQPNRVSWFLWGLAPMIAFAAQISEGVGIQAVITFMFGFGPFVIFFASFTNRKAYWKLGPFDYICGLISVAALSLWAITKDGNMAIAFSIIADVLASTPTLLKAYKVPKSEVYFPYALIVLSSAITLLTVDRWVFAEYGFTAWVLILCLLIAFFVKFEPVNLIKRQKVKLL